MFELWKNYGNTHQKFFRKFSVQNTNEKNIILNMHNTIKELF